MASGHTHEWITLAGAAVTFGLVLYCGVSVLSALITSLGTAFGGIYLSPDLDLKRSLPHRAWGFLDIFWRPYCHVLYHRHVLSHGWLIGTFLRLCYLAVLLAPILVFTGLPPDWTWSYIGHFLGGIFIGSELHLLTDVITTGDNDTRSHWI